MSKQPRKIAKVAIVYSDDAQYSLESKNLAFYFCGLLSSSGYADVNLVPYSRDGPTTSLPSSNTVKINYYETGKSKPQEVPAADFEFAHWSVLTECHLVVVTVNGPDTKNCAIKLAETLANHKYIPVFSMQRGLRFGSILSDEIEAKGIVMIEAVVGFSVVADGRLNALKPTVRYPAVVYERLSKEDVKYADGPLRLLETMNVDVFFRKVLTPHAWGMLMIEHLYALNIITKGGLYETLMNPNMRSLYSKMIRETIDLLVVASKGGEWKPDITLLTSYLTPKLYELILALPSPIFYLIFWFMRILPPAGTISPGQYDLLEGRSTTVAESLQEVVDTSIRLKSPCPTCEAVLDVIRSIERTQGGNTIAANYRSMNLQQQLESVLSSANVRESKNETVQELLFWTMRGLIVLSFLFLFIFLFKHEF